MDIRRAVKPPVFPVQPLTLAPVRKVLLENAIPVYTIESGTEDITRMEFVFRAGQIKETSALQSSTTNMMLTEGSEDLTSEEINRLLDFYGVFFHLYADKDLAGLVVFFLSRHSEKVIQLSHQILFRPVFPEKEFSVLMKKRLRWYLVNREKVQNLAADKFFESIFGPSHPYGRQVNQKDFESLNTSMLKEFHNNFYTPGDLTIIVSGRPFTGTVEILNKYFGSLKTGVPSNDKSIISFNGEEDKKVRITKQGAVQSSIRIGSVTIDKRHPDYPGLKVMNTMLGGYFGSRLMKNIREEKGYTYGINSVLTSLNISGYKVVIADVSTKNAYFAIDEIYKEIKRLQNEAAGKEELEVVRNYLSGEMVRMFDGPFAVAESFRSVWEFDLDFNYYSRLEEKIKTITPEEILELANKYFKIEELYEIIAG